MTTRSWLDLVKNDRTETRPSPPVCGGLSTSAGSSSTVATVAAVAVVNIPLGAQVFSAAPPSSKLLLGSKESSKAKFFSKTPFSKPEDSLVKGDERLISKFLNTAPPSNAESRRATETLHANRFFRVEGGISLIGSCGPDVFICGKLIKNSRSWDSIKEFFDQMPPNLKNTVVYNIFIGRKDQGNFTVIKGAFEEAKERNLADVVTFNSFIDACGKAGEFEKARIAFKEAKKRNLADVDVAIFNSFIDVCGKAGEFEDAESAFEEAKQRNLADVVTFNSFINACGKAGEFKKARIAFKEAKKRNLANEVSFNSFIDVCGKAGEFEDAKSAFEEAKKRNLADVVSFTSFIDACGKAGKFKDAESAFKEAKERNLADVAIFNSFIDVLIKRGSVDEAKKVLAESKMALPEIRKNQKGDRYIVDLHKLSHGVGILLLLDNLKSVPMDIIVGKGLHGDNEWLAFQTAVKDFFGSTEGVSIQPDPANPGRLVLEKRP